MNYITSFFSRYIVNQIRPVKSTLIDRYYVTPFRTRCLAREEKNLNSFLNMKGSFRWLETSFEPEGPYYWATVSMCVHSPARWRVTRLSHLQRLLCMAHARHLNPSLPQKITNPTPLDYHVYKSQLVFFGLIDFIYKEYFKVTFIAPEMLFMHSTLTRKL